MHTLPDGYTVRPARREDAAQLALVVQLVQIPSLGEAEDTASTVLGDMEAPGMNLATDSLVVWRWRCFCAKECRRLKRRRLPT